jgi:glycosyltransferase involved in cell wall biosynthesis
VRIGIDLTALLPQATGVDTYLLGLVRGLAAIDLRNRYVLFVNREDRERLPELPPRFELVGTSTRDRAVRLGFQQLALPVLAAARRLDVIHSPSFILPLAAPHVKHVLTVHDMTSFSHAKLHEPLRRSWLYKTAILASIRRADRVCVPSGVVRDQILRFVPEANPARIRAIPHGISAEFRPDARPITGNGRPDVPRAYLLYVGTIEPRKNLELLLRCYGRLARAGAIEEDLVLAGRLGWGYEQVVTLAGAPDLRGRVHLLGYVDQGALPGLYAGARVFVYPSLEEGFGFPPLEAMACGVPVVASTAPALSENLAGAAELVPAHSPEALADAILRLLRDERLWERRRREGLDRAGRFGWEEAARTTLSCYEELGAGSAPAAEPA